MVCFEDNIQCLGAVKSGYSLALRSLPRTERISLSVASVLNMSILNLDMFVLSFDMFLLIYYQSDWNFDQFDVNIGQTIYSYVLRPVRVYGNDGVVIFPTQFSL